METGDADIEARQVIYRGRVQGVGFRYTTASIATRFIIAGYVRNLPDGRVEIVAQGQIETIDLFLAEVSATFTGNITESIAAAIEYSGQFTGFEIRY